MSHDLPRRRSCAARPATAFEDASAAVPFLTRLSPAERDRLRERARVREIAPYRPVWREEETSQELLLLLRGRVKLSRTTEAGRDVILHACAPGEMLCAGLPSAGARYCCTATVLHERVEVLALPRRGLAEGFEQSPTLARALLQEAAGRETILVQRIEELSAGHVERRVAALLTRLSDQVGTERPGRGWWLPIVFSRQDLADLCGTTLETAIRTMTRLSRAGLVRTARGGFWIADRTRLAALARGEPLV